jgi:hypothetical protein
MAGPFEQLDFDAFHRKELPRRLAAGNGALAARATHRLDSLAFRRSEGGAYTYVPGPDGVAVVEGDDSAETVMELDHEAWEGLVQELESAPGLLYGNRVRCRRGKAMNMVVWEPALRAMFNGRPIFDPHEERLADRHGRPLDVEQTFSLESDPRDSASSLTGSASNRQDMAHFLRTAGYLLVREVFGPEEIAGFLEEAQELRGEAVRGDKLSWWGKNARGEEVLCRVTRAGAKPRLATIPEDPRIVALKDLSDENLTSRARGSDETVSVIYKNPDMTEGLSDIPWHRDCGMGGHAVMCPVLIVSTFLTPATPETGELKMLPGSWKASYPYVDPNHPRAPRGARFAARPGDVSLHYGDVMHAAPPPTRSDLDGYRISAVTGFAKPGVRHHRGGKHYNEVLHGREDGQIEHLEKVANRS